MRRGVKCRLLIMTLLLGCMQVSGRTAVAVEPSSTPEAALVDEQAELLLYEEKYLITAISAQANLLYKF